MTKSFSLSPRESAALAAARRALAEGALAEVARHYEEAARARARDGGDDKRHLRRALDFWVAAGESTRGLACARKLLAARGSAKDRGPVYLAAAQLELLAGRPRRALRAFASARQDLGRDRDRRRLAQMGEAEARIALGEPLAARALFARCLADAERSGDAWAACAAGLRLATLDLWLGDALGAREALEEVRTRAAARHLQSLEAEAASVLAQAELALGRADQGQREAEHAAHLYREMGRDRDADYVGRWEAAAIAVRLATLDPVARESAGPVLWRQALRKLAKAREAAPGRRIAEAEILMQEAALLRGRAASERVRRAKRVWPGIARPPRPPWGTVDEPAPRIGALSRVLGERRAEHERLMREFAGQTSVPTRVRVPARRDPDGARWMIQEAARRSAPRFSDSIAVPPLRLDERLVVFSRSGDTIEAWVAPGPSAHFTIGEVAAWRTALEEIERQVRDAEGWPDSVVPETLIDNSRRTMARVGESIWTPLWPALTGAARVLVLPDPALPELPWTALMLAAQPERWPRPRMLSLLPSASLARPPAWSLRPGRSLALAERSAEQSIAEREARAVARVLRGQWKTLAPGALDALGRATVHHWAPVVLVSRPSAALTRLPDGDASIPIWRLARERIRPQLMVLPRLEAESRMPLEVARIVGRVGPEGAHRAGEGSGAAPRKSVPSFPKAGQLARALLAGGAARVVVNAWPYEAPASAGLVGAFYAGLARGDGPAESLFTAQRRAFEEGLHPAAWAGFSMWGWT
ncbi:MAG TPA: CHAT domain-containing protein [Candidatus Eisenbacteria bacterium]|nr:CHAT domain-containing protein [Candidatus Eisenbacteria bacterium]